MFTVSRLLTQQALDNTEVYSGELSHQTVTGVVVNSVTWRQTDLILVDFHRCQFNAVQWQANRLSQVRFIDCDFRGSAGILPHQADWCGNDCRAVTFINCRFEDFQCRQVWFDSIEFVGCDFGDTNFAIQGKGERLSLTNCTGYRLCVHHSEVDSISLAQCQLGTVVCAQLICELLVVQSVACGTFEPYGQIQQCEISDSQMNKFLPGGMMSKLTISDTRIEMMIEESLDVAKLDQESVTIGQHFCFD